MQTGRLQRNGAQVISHGACPERANDRGPAAIDYRRFSTVYAHYLTPAMRWLRAHGVPDWDTEDMAQEVFTVVYRKLQGFDGDNLGGWIYAICKRTASDYRRRAWFRHAVLRRDEFSEERLPSPHGSPAAALETKERYRLMWRILSKMSAKRRTVFVLFEVEGCTGAEIAELEQIPEKTVWSRLAMARKQFIELERQLRCAERARGEG